MKTVKISELKDQLSAHIREVERGGEVIVTDRNRPVARISPVSESGQALRIDPPKAPFASIRRKKWRPAQWPVGSDTLLDEERGER